MQWYYVSLLSCLWWFVLDIFEPYTLSFLRCYHIIPIPKRCFSQKQFFHAVISGLGSLYVVWYEPGPVPQPLASFVCEFTTTSRVAMIIPRLSLGYAVHDMLDGIQKQDLAFTMHGIGLGGVLLYMELSGFTSIAVYPLLMEISSIFYNMRALNWNNSVLNDILDVSFAVSFLWVRFILMNKYLITYLYMGLTTDPTAWGSCMNYTVLKVVFLFWLLFFSLNCYWGKFLLKKMKRRICKSCFNNVNFDQNKFHPVYPVENKNKHV